MNAIRVTKIRRQRSRSKRSSVSKSKHHSFIRIHTRIRSSSSIYPENSVDDTSDEKKLTDGRKRMYHTHSHSEVNRVSDQLRMQSNVFVLSESTANSALKFDERSKQSSNLGTFDDIIKHRKTKSNRKAKFICCCPRSPACVYLVICIVLIAVISLAALLTGLLVGSQRKTTTSATIKPPILYVNLVTNGDGETGPCESEWNVTSPTGWHYSGPITQIYYNKTVIIDQTLTTPGPSDRGQCYFYGQLSVSTSMWQTIYLLDYTHFIFIDSQSLKFNVSAWIGGYLGQNDHAIVSVFFTDQMNQPIGTNTTIGPVLISHRSAQTALLFRQATAYVPIGSRYLTVLVTIIRTGGSYSNGNVDNIAVYLYQ